MTRAAVIPFHLLAWTSALTGAVYGVMRYWPLPEDALSLTAHPSQPTFQHAHILLSAGLALMLGYVAGCHAVPYVAGGVRTRRKTGWTMLSTGAPMVLSGFALQTSTGELARAVWSVAHIGTSVVWTLTLALHLLLRRQPPS